MSMYLRYIFPSLHSQPGNKGLCCLSVKVKAVQINFRLPGGLGVKNLPANSGDIGDAGLIPGPGRSTGGPWQPTPVFLPGESLGQRTLVGYGPQGHKESDTTEAT